VSMPSALTAGVAPEIACALCGFVYVPQGDACREHRCPFAISGCTTRHCPRCGYAVPDEEGSLAARFVRKLVGGGGGTSAHTLADLPAGAAAVVELLRGEPALLARLTAQGLAPGVAVRLLQRAPTFVVEMGETTIAIERAVAEAIVLRAEPAVR